MGTLFTLDVETNAAERRAVLRLADEAGRPLGKHAVALDEHAPSRWEALFDTRRYVRRMKGSRAPDVLLAEVGAFLGEHVLGPAIAKALAAGDGQRTVLVRLGDPEGDALAGAFARVPWEMARAPGEQTSLLGNNVVVRAAPAGATPARERAIALPKDEVVRVLLVFAEAPGSRPLAARLERERLLDLFFEEVLPHRNVEVDVLCHGVTRARIVAEVKKHGGYHVVHWSGHGNVDALEVGLDEDEVAKKVSTAIRGKELVALFKQAGGFIPPVVFLSACHSGAVREAKDWASLQALMRGTEEGREGSPAVEALLDEKVGFTGTALALVEAGVKQVVAMRYEVGDRYARRLGRRFYRHLLGEAKAHSVDEALSLARKEVWEDVARKEEYEAVDHATPLVFGSELVRVEAKGKKSAQMGRQSPRGLLEGGSTELDPPRGFVGRGKELTELWRKWLAREGAPIVVIQGLAGLGKTSLAAEAIHLWFESFDHVIAFQAKGGALSIDAFYRGIDLRLVKASTSYQERCKDNELGRVYFGTGGLLKDNDRVDAMRENLVAVLGSERILIVLDNFEANLFSDGKAEDPAWDALLAMLGSRLHRTGSRVLITSRHKLAALGNRKDALWMPLGPLPIEEARLFFEGQGPIRGLLHGDEDGLRLARKILDVSRGHPLILARIADLARAYYDKVSGLGSAGRKALEEALDKIRGDGYKALSDVFAEVKTEQDKERERAYLEEVAVGAVDLLIDRSSPEARRLLWVVTRAGEPVAEDMIAGVWSGESAEDAQLRQLAQLLRMLDMLPPEARARVPPVPDEIRVRLEALQARTTPDAPPIEPLLGELCEAGLLVREDGALSFHELVAERAATWIEQHPEERGDRSEAEIWTAYGERYGAAFHVLIAAAKRDQASEAGRRGIRYLVRARAFDRLGNFASGVVTGTRDPALLGQVIADLQGAAAEAPAGEARWSLRTYLADALDNAGRPDQALSFYQEAAEEAETAQHWADLGWICINWAGALRNVGQLDRARETYLRSAEALQRGGRPRVAIVGSELEALRVDVMQGRPEQALPAIEAKLGEVRGFWAKRQAGEAVPEAPDRETLTRALRSGLDIAREANVGLERWQVSLDLLGELEQVKRALGVGEHELARTRFNRYGPLLRLGKLTEAKTVLEGCLEVFQRVGDVTNEATALSALADVWDDLGDSGLAILLGRRALAVHERLPDPQDRAISHNNLANYLHKTGAKDEAKAHQLAALVYRLVTGIDSRDSLGNLTNRIREATSRGETFTFPRLADLLATPAFAPLRTFLEEREIDTDDLQTTLDQLVEQTRTSFQTSQTPARPALGCLWALGIFLLASLATAILLTIYRRYWLAALSATPLILAFLFILAARRKSSQT